MPTDERQPTASPAAELLAAPDDAARRRWLDAVLGASPDAGAVAALLETLAAHRAVDPRAALAAAEALASWLVADAGGSVPCPGPLRACWVEARSLEAAIRTGDLGDHVGALRALDAASDAIAGGWEGDAALASARLAPRRVRALAMMGRLDDARACHAEARTTLEAAGAWDALAGLETDLAGGLWRASAFRDVLTAAGRARAAFARSGAMEAAWLPALGQIEALALLSLGRLDEADRTFATAIRACDAAGDAVRGAAARTNRARACFELGHAMTGLELLDEAERTFRAAGLDHLVLMTLLVRQDMLGHLGRHHALLQTAEAALAVPADAGSPREWGQLHASRASALAGLRQPAEARAALADARGWFRRDKNAEWIAECDLREAALSLDTGDARNVSAARALAQAAGEVFRRLGAPRDAARADVLVARADLAAGDAGCAAARLESVIEAAPLPVAAEARVHRARALAAMGDLAAARAASDEALAALDALVGRVALGMRRPFLVERAGAYAAAVRWALKEGDADAAFALSERGRARALVDALAFDLPLAIRPRDAGDEALVARLEAARADHAAAARAWRAAGDGDAALEARVVDAEQSLEDAWEALLVRGADYARQASTLRPIVGDVRAHLEAGDVLLSFIDVGERLACFVVRPGGIAATELDAGPEHVGHLAERLRDGLALRAAAGSGAAPALDRHAAHYLAEIADALLSPVAAAVEDARRVLVVPCAPLHDVPFAALPDAGGEPLVARRRIVELPSAGVLGLVRSKPDAAGKGMARGHGAATFGHSAAGRLPRAVAEAEAVAARLGGACALEEGASRLAILRALAERDVVHVAGHAVFRADEPLLGGIEAADGLISVMDLAQADVRARLVVLSGCRTGEAAGEGDALLGLAGTLLARGASCVVAARWPVDDEAAGALMLAFHERLAAGAAVDEALAGAQGAMREGALGIPWRHPFHWGGFVVFGDGALAPFGAPRAVKDESCNEEEPHAVEDDVGRNGARGHGSGRRGPDRRGMLADGPRGHGGAAEPCAGGGDDRPARSQR